MSQFKVTIEKIKILPHDNADRLEIVHLKGKDYQCVVNKGSYKTGESVFYIPEQSLVPVEIQKFLNIEDKLVGPNKNRVKAIKLRGVLSQGLVLPVSYLSSVNKHSFYGDRDWSKELGIVKYEPKIPKQLSGNVWNAGPERTINYDINNIKNHPDLFNNGMIVAVTEKLHGTWMCVGVMPSRLKHPVHGDVIITSKGNSGKGLAFKMPVKPRPQSGFQKIQEAFFTSLKFIMIGMAKLNHKFGIAKVFNINKAISFVVDVLKQKIIEAKNLGVNNNNLYCLVEKELKISEKIKKEFGRELKVEQQPVFIIGEVFGAGVQDLKYGCNKPTFRAFDIFIGTSPKWSQPGFFLSDQSLDSYLKFMNIERVPVLWRGRYNAEKIKELTSGNETISGTHMREGVVIRPILERDGHYPGLPGNRLQLKSINEAYLLRRGKVTEYN